EDVVVVRACLALRGLDHRREVRVRDVRDDQAQGGGAPRDECPSSPVLPVVQLLGGGRPPLACLRVDQVRGGEGGGAGGDMHATGSGHILDGGRHSAPPLGRGPTIPYPSANVCATVNVCAIVDAQGAL